MTKNLESRLGPGQSQATQGRLKEWWGWTRKNQYRRWIYVVTISSAVLGSLILALEWQDLSLNFLGQSYTHSVSKPRQTTSIGHAEQSSNKDQPAPTQNSSQPASEVQLAEDFPQEVPIYPGKITATSRSEVARRKAWTVSLEATSSLDRAVEDVKAQLKSHNWHMDSELVDSQSVTIAASKDQLAVVVYVMSAKDQTKFNYTITEQK